MVSEKLDTTKNPTEACVEPTKLSVLETITNLLHSTLDLREIFNSIVDIISHTVHTDVCSLYLVNKNKRELILSATKGLSQKHVGRVKIPLGEGITSWAAMEKKIMIIENASSHPRYKHIPEMEEKKYSSMLSIPLVDQGVPIGVINVESIAPRKFTQEEIMMLNNIAGQVAGAVRNAQLFADVSRRLAELSTLHEVGKAISSTLDLEKLVDLVVRTSLGIIGARVCVLRLLNKKTNQLDIKAIQGCYGSEDETNCLFQEEMAAKRVFEENSPSFSSSLICVPLVVQDEVIGTLSIYENHDLETKETISFSDDELRLFSILASQAAIAIENARLFDEKVKAQKSLKEVQSKLIRSEKLATLGQIAAGVAHEIRNPLVSIGGFARLIARDMPDSDINKKYIDIIIAEVGRLEKTISQVINFARPLKLNIKNNININRVLEDALLFVANIGSRISVVKEFDPHLPEINADPDLLKQGFINVLKNAVEAITEEGTIMIKTFTEKQWIHIEISDSGGGIDPEDLKKIFNPFHSTKGSEGLGLGLDITHRIINAHGGDIELISQLGSGTTCEIILPRG